jgi:tRNA pseudouridine55 synthase
MNNNNNQIIVKDGIINIYKEKGYTSHDVVAILRKKFRMKKIGHTGTLDPEAEGVLPLCLGKGTKVADFITNKSKIYSATLKLGEVTDTQDHTGEVIKKSEVTVEENKIINVIMSFIGDYDQIPPMYSAIKVNGKKLYELARKGIEIERKSRKITIYDIYNISIKDNIVALTVCCSKGTYIRTLCNDIGEKLGCGAHMTSLVRVKSGVFNIENSIKLEQVGSLIDNNTINEVISNIDSVFESYPSLIVNEDYNKYLYNGNKLKEEYIKDSIELIDKKTYRLYDKIGKFIGIYECIKEDQGILKPIKVFI